MRKLNNAVAFNLAIAQDEIISGHRDTNHSIAITYGTFEILWEAYKLCLTIPNFNEEDTNA